MSGSRRLGAGEVGFRGEVSGGRRHLVDDDYVPASSEPTDEERRQIADVLRRMIDGRIQARLRPRRRQL